VSTGRPASLPTVAEHGTARLVPVGLNPHRDRVIDGVSGLAHHRLDREVDRAPDSGNGISPPTRRICHQVQAFVLQPSSGGTYQPPPE
jgi:hypothetical protein